MQPHSTRQPHNFRESLERSKGYAHAPWWEAVYREAFPTMHSMQYIADDGWAQRAGIDRRIHLSSGKTIDIDEKVREEEWPDFFLEVWSDRDRQTPGWVRKDLSTDYLAYAFVPSQTCYLLPFRDLQRAYWVNREEWKRYPVRNAQNDGYVTTGVCVPINVVLDAIRNGMVLTW